MENKERLGEEILKISRSLYNTKHTLPVEVSGILSNLPKPSVPFHFQTLYSISVTILEGKFSLNYWYR